MDIAILFNNPLLARDHDDYEQEAGVLESVAAFGVALRSAGHRVREVGLDNSLEPVIELAVASRPDVVVNLCEGFAGHTAGEAHVAGLLELLRLPYTGCPPECLALVHDKARTKWLLQGAGLPTAPFVRLRRGEATPRKPLTEWLDRGPLFVKPAAEDASLGIGPESVVVDWHSLKRQVERISAQYGDVLIEPFIDGREFNVSVIALRHVDESLRDSNSASHVDESLRASGFASHVDESLRASGFASRRDAATCLPLAEIEFKTSAELPWPIVTYEAKWASHSHADNSTPVRCPADVDPALADSIRATALAAFEATGCRDYARVDLRVDRAGNIYILEVNANPDAGPTAGFSRALKAAGIEYADFVERLVHTAARRGSSATLGLGQNQTGISRR